jgi:polyisoprenoid-binding protein YceI
MQALSRSLALLAACAALPAPAAVDQFNIDPNHTFVTFEIDHLGIATQRGRFNRTSGKVMLDQQEGKGSVDIMIDARSIDTGGEAMENMLRGKDFFDVEEFPDISYKGEMTDFSDGQPQRVEGTLTLLGVTKPVTLTVKHLACTRKPLLLQLRCGVDATAMIHRSEFGMTSMSAFTSDEVRLLIQAEAVLPPKPQTIE